MAIPKPTLLGRPFIAPVGGWNTRDPLPLMPETDAIELVNLLPTTFGLEIRPTVEGIINYSIGTDDVDTVVVARFAGATRRIVCTDGEIYEITNITQTDISGSLTITDDTWQHVMFADKLMMVNNTDNDVVVIGSTGNGALANYTGTGLTNKLFCNLEVYKGRLFIAESNTLSAWYTQNTEAVTGTLIQLDLSGQFRLGGVMLAICTITLGQAYGTEELIVFMSDVGEAVVYAGSYPGDTNWAQVSRFRIPRPLGFRCFKRVPGDVFCYTEAGIVSIGQTISKHTHQDTIFVNDKINKAFQDVIAQYFFGENEAAWEMEYVPNANLLICQVPMGGTYVQGDTGYSEHYVLNLNTQAWARWTGIDSKALYYDSYGDDPRLLFGAQNGNVGFLRFNEGYPGDGFDDNLDNVNTNDYEAIADQYFVGAFSIMDSRKLKIVRGARAMVGRTGRYKNNVKVYTDYDMSMAQSASSLEKAKTGAETYEYYDIYHGVAAYGRAIAVGMDVKDTAGANSARIFGVDLLYEEGGLTSG